MENEFLLECTFNSLINKNTYSFFKSCNNLYLESYIKKNFFQILKKKIIKIINKIKFNLKRIFIIIIKIIIILVMIINQINVENIKKYLIII